MTATLLTPFLFSLKHSSMLRTENKCRVLGARGANTVHEGGQATSATEVTANNLILKQ